MLARTGITIPTGEIVRHMGAPIGVHISTQKRLDWVMSKIGRKWFKWAYMDLHFWARVKIKKKLL